MYSKPKIVFVPFESNDCPTKGIAVDCSVVGGNPGLCEIRGVDIRSGEIVFDETLGIATNNIAEYVAIAYGVEYLKSNHIYGVPIWSDSKICINWVERNFGCKTNFFTHYPDKAKLNIPLTQIIIDAEEMIEQSKFTLLFWNKWKFGKEIPADYGRK